MTTKPRIHHFVPQFWIKKFTSLDGTLWGYEWADDRIKDRSPKRMMQILDLYTIQPSGADDTSLETTELSEIDTMGARAFERVLNGDLSEATKGELATFLAAQMMRDPDSLSSYRLRSQEVALHLLDAPNATDYASFTHKTRSLFPGIDITESEFDYCQSLGNFALEQAVDLIIQALDARGGIPELPFTDLVRNPDGRNIIRQRLLSFTWHIKTDPEEGFVLGDAAVLFEKGDLESGLRTPLSKNTALYLMAAGSPTPGITAACAQSFEVDAINNESAARTRRWLVGERSRLEMVKKQVTANELPKA